MSNENLFHCNLFVDHTLFPVPRWRLLCQPQLYGNIKAVCSSLHGQILVISSDLEWTAFSTAHQPPSSVVTQFY